MKNKKQMNKIGIADKIKTSDGCRRSGSLGGSTTVI